MAPEPGGRAETRGGGAPQAPAVEIVTIGDELLLGETVDGNGAWLGRTLAGAGIRVASRATVGDDAAAIADAVARALERTGTVICTGGLGPTHDDLTKPAVARVFGRPLVLDPGLLEDIRSRFELRGVDMPALNRSQAEVPEGATVFPNGRGTAPGLALTDGRRAAVLLPGVPFEMRALMEEQVLPWLERRWPQGRRPIRHRLLRTTGLAESALAERVDDVVRELAGVSVAFLPSPTGVDLRLTSGGVLDAEASAAALDAAEASLRGRLGDVVYATGDLDLTDTVVDLLRGRGLTLAVAESCTGGLLAKRLTDREGASEYFLGCVVAYADDAKRRLLGVKPETLSAHGAVSEAVALEMAEGARARLGGGAALSITGVAGPGGGTPEKPVGTVWIACVTPEAGGARRFRFGGDRAQVRERSAQAALALLRARLTGRP